MGNMRCRIIKKNLVLIEINCETKINEALAGVLSELG